MAPQRRRQDETGTHETGGVRRRTFLRATGAAGAIVAGTGLAGTAAAATDLPPIERDGNKLTAGGEEIELHGVNIADPKRIDVTSPARGKTAAQAIEMATDESIGMYSNVVRLPVQPVDILESEPGTGPDAGQWTDSQLTSYMEDHLDAAVQACADNGAYAIIDYHRHRNMPWGGTDEETGEFSPNQALSDELVKFWDIVAAKYGDMDHVIFEMYNEPQGNPDYQSTGQDLIDYWGNWKSTAQPWVDTIREHSDNLVLVGSPMYSQATWGIAIEEFEGENLAYTMHLYPAHAPTTPADYDDFLRARKWGSEQPYDTETPAYEIAPIVMSEWGFDPDGGVAAGGGVNKETVETYKEEEGVDWPEHDPDYGKHVTEWLSTRPVHSTAWVFDPSWTPRMVDFGFETDGDVGTPYNDEPIPEKCSELPCEWTLLTGDYMGDTVAEFLTDRMVAEYSGADDELQPSEVVDAKGDYVMGDISLEAVQDIMRSYFFG